MSPNISWEMLVRAGRLGNLPWGKLGLAWRNSSWDEFKMKRSAGTGRGRALDLRRGKLGSARRNCPRGQLILLFSLSITLAAAGRTDASTTHQPIDSRLRPQAPVSLMGSGFVLDSSHPMRPGDARRYPLDLRITAWPSQRAFAIAVSDSGDTTSRPDVWYVRPDGASRADTAGVETPEGSLGDVSAAALAVIEPKVASACGAFVHHGGTPKDPFLHAPWEILPPMFTLGARSRLHDENGFVPRELYRNRFDERFGDDLERVDYAFSRSDSGAVDPETTSVYAYGREVGRFIFHWDSAVRPLAVPPPGPTRNDVESRSVVHQLAPEQVTFRELVPHVFLVDLDSLNTRVVVAEFSESLAVIEGAFGSGPCDVLARAVQQRFHKPVRVFAFSHLHGQYSGGTRSWVHEGATVVVPPSTEPLIHRMVDASFASHPDALARDPKPLRLQGVPQHLHLEDSTNALDIYNVPSGHTDEYFLFHFPRQHVLLTGDLMFLRPGKPFGGRSKLLAQNVAKLGLAVDTYVASWPLHGFGTKNIVTAAEFAQACADTAGAPHK